MQIYRKHEIDLKLLFLQFLCPLFITIVGFAAFANTLTSPFIFDDYRIILSRNYISKILPLFPGPRCLVDLTFKLNYFWNGFNVAGYHLVNIIIHVISGLLLYGIVWRTCMLPRFKNRSKKRAFMIGATCASLWLVHPLQTESVTYICQRYESMMGMFFFLVLYCFIRSLTSKHKKTLLFLTVISCFLGMATKEIMIIAPLIVIIYDYTFCEVSIIKALRSRTVFYIGLFSSWLFFAILLLCDIERGTFHAVNSFFKMSPVVYLFSQFGVIIRYFRLSFVPVGLCFDYEWEPVESLAAGILPCLGISILLMITLMGFAKRRIIGFIGAWFFLILAPTSSIVPIIDLAFEHRMYLSLASVIIGVVLLVNISIQKLNIKKYLSFRKSVFIQLTLFICSVFLLCHITRIRNLVYQSEETVWEDVVRKRPGNFRANIALISILVNNKKAHKAEKIARNLILRMERMNLQNNYRYARAVSQLGSAQLSSGKTDDAIRSFQKAVKVWPKYATAYYNMSIALYKNNHKNQAVSACKTAIRFRPEYGNAYALLGFYSLKQGAFSEAVDYYKQALKYNKCLLSAQLDLAWLFASAPDTEIRDGRRAINMALNICDKTNWNSFKALDLLAAGFAEIGQYKIAENWMQKAIRISSERPYDNNFFSDQNEISGALKDIKFYKKEMNKRLALYKLRKPYRIKGDLEGSKNILQ